MTTVLAPRSTTALLPQIGAQPVGVVAIEATFCRLKDFHRIATRYDKLARNYASAVALAAIIAFWC